jgi:hypothetical protein
VWAPLSVVQGWTSAQAQAWGAQGWGTGVGGAGVGGEGVGALWQEASHSFLVGKVDPLVLSLQTPVAASHANRAGVGASVGMSVGGVGVGGAGVGSTGVGGTGVGALGLVSANTSSRTCRSWGRSGSIHPCHAHRTSSKLHTGPASASVGPESAAQAWAPESAVLSRCRCRGTCRVDGQGTARGHRVLKKVTPDECDCTSGESHIVPDVVARIW